jgi:tetratricopeptide (TPR) repeat protein
MSSLFLNEIYEILEEAKQYESIGRYDEAAKVLSPYWKNTSERPDVSELPEDEQAEMLMRCGSLAGYISSCKQKKDGQELAQTLIIEASRLFSLLRDYEKVAECETYYAYTCLRTGKLDEARCWINSALKHEIDNHGEVRLYSYVLDGMILFREEKYAELVSRCKVLEPLFRNSGFLILQGDFNNNYAYGLMELDKKNESLTRFELAKQFYKRTKHYLYLAGLENNLAVFFQKEGYYIEAHKHAKAAREAFKKLGDKTREGYSIDTQAQIFMAQGNYEEALKCANEAISILENGENYCYLANSMQTKSHILFCIKDYVAAQETMIASVNIASIQISKTQAKRFIEQYVELQKNRGMQ